MNKRGKQASSVWWWVETKVPNSFGIFRWVGHYNVKDEREAKLTIRALRAIEARDGTEPQEWRFVGPGYDHEPDRKAQDKLAATGRCPACDAKPRTAKKGRSKGYIAFKCGKCDHTWRLAGTRDPAYAATRLSKALGGSVGGEVASKKGKKAQKGKEKKPKKAKRA